MIQIVGCDVEEEHVVGSALEGGPLQGGTQGDRLVRVDPLTGAPVEQPSHPIADQRHAGHPPHEDDLCHL